MVMILYF